MNDEKIIDLYWSRNEQAINETEAAYGKSLHTLANRILRCPEDAEECVSDTYLKAWGSIPPQRPRCFFAYLAQICRRLAFGRLDWNNAEKRRADIVSITSEMELCIPDKMAQARMEDKEIGKLISAFLDTLPQDSRLIFMRRYWYNDSIEEIAVRCSMGTSKVKTRLFRIRARLKNFLEQEEITL